MYLRRYILGAAAAVPMLVAMAGAARAEMVSPDVAKAFITQSGKLLVGIVNGPGTEAQKSAALRHLVNQIVAVDQVGDYVLGRYIRVATPEQHKKFLALFHQLIAYNITYQIHAYKGVTFTVNGAQPLGNDMVVDTTIVAPGKAPVNVGWAVDKVDGQPKIVDVIVAGTSLRITTRNDYAAVIADHGGHVSALLAAMKRQIDRLSGGE